MRTHERIRAWLAPRTASCQDTQELTLFKPESGLGVALAAGLMGLAALAFGQIQLAPLGTYATGIYDASAAEIADFDPATDRIFFTNAQANTVIALDAADPTALSFDFSIDLSPFGGGVNSVTVLNGGIAVAVEASPKTDPGVVVFFDLDGTFISQVTVGALPDMVTVSPDGTKVLVANEGEPNNDYTIDPIGSVSIIDISGGLASLTNANVTSIDFTGYTPDQLPGVRIFGPGATVAQDMEPEYIAVSDDSQLAFVVCQENNAVVRINLLTNTIEQITALGMKDHSIAGQGLDPRDAPAGINIANWPVKGMYMPDAIDAFTVGGQTYVVCANEGDAREYGIAIVEPRRIGNAGYVLDPTVFPNAATLKQNANLGRLNASTASGDLDNDGDLDEIHVFGSRSFSVRDANGALIWDSGDQFEQITAAAYPANFNASNTNNSLDNRSDDKGPEPEAIVVGDVYGVPHAFIGLERVGGIMVYDMTNPAAPVFVQYINNRIFSGTPSAGTAGDLGLEGLAFVSAAESPNGMPLLIASNEISGTVTVFGIEPPPFQLQILHASDFEGAVPATQDAPRFAAILDSLEHTYTNSLTLSSGDNFLPGPFMSAGEDPSLVTPLRNAYIHYYGGVFANNDLRAGIGRVDITILNILGVQASVLGNHEFDLGTSELRNIIAGQNSGTNIRWFGAQFPYLSSNLNFGADASLSSLFTATREEPSFFQSNPAMTAAAIVATKKLAPSTIINVNGELIGVVGATTQILASISTPGATTIIGPSSNDMPALAAILQPVIDSLIIAEGIDKIILLSHLQQLTLEKQLALLLNGVDVIIAGGSHTLMADAMDRMRTGDIAAETYPFLTTGLDGRPVAIVNTTSEYQYVGRLVVDFDTNGEIITASIDPAISGAYPADSLGVVEVWGDYASAFTPGSKGQQVRNLCNAVENVIISKDGNIFGRTDVFLEGRRNFVRTEETNLGNVSADANKWMARRYNPSVTISIKNGGGIRSAIGVVNAVGSTVSLDPPAANPIAGKQQGDISQLDIENSLRFNNLLSALTLTATNLRTILEHGVAASGPGQTQGRFPQISGVRFSYDETLPANARILNAVVTDSAGITLDTLVQNGALYGNPTRIFRVVTLNFLAGGGDGYPFNTLGTARVDLNTLSDAGPGAAAFAIPGSEQDAFAEFMKSFHNVAPYALGETPASADERIQEVNDRPDCILPPRFYADSDSDTYGDPNDFVTVCPGNAPTGYVTDSSDDCPTTSGRNGDVCNDNNPFTINDVLVACGCAGTPVPCDTWTLELNTDGAGSEIGWSIEEATSGFVLASGASYPNNTTAVEPICIPQNNCFNLIVTDGGGNGISGGGYVLRSNTGARIIDNAGNGAAFTSTSQAAQPFCTDVSATGLIASRCDKLDHLPNRYIVTTAIPAVSAEWILGGANNVQDVNSGYEFWIFDPNGGYSFRRFRSHNMSDGYSPATATRACHMKINSWANTGLTPHIPNMVLMNVRVRGRVNGTNLDFGPACRFKIDPVRAACPLTKLLVAPGDARNSCGVVRSFANGNFVYATPVTFVPAVPTASVRYQFRFRNAEGAEIIRTSSTYTLQLNWTNAPALLCGQVYQVDVRVSKNGGATWCVDGAGAWGDVCTVTITACPDAQGMPMQNVDATNATLTMYPNPNSGGQLFISLSEVAADVKTVSMDIFDMTGKRVAARTITVQDGFINQSVELNGELSGGLYMVNITAGDKTFTERLVIQP